MATKGVWAQLEMVAAVAAQPIPVGTQHGYAFIMAPAGARLPPTGRGTSCHLSTMPSSSPCLHHLAPCVSVCPPACPWGLRPCV